MLTNIGGLIAVISRLINNGFFAAVNGGKEVLGIFFPGVFDNIIGQVQNGLGTAVIFLQANYLVCGKTSGNSMIFLKFAPRKEYIDCESSPTAIMLPCGLASRRIISAWI